MIAGAVVLLLAMAGLVAWRWQLADRAAQRGHELAVHATRVQVDQVAIDKALGEVATLRERVKVLEYRPIPR